MVKKKIFVTVGTTSFDSLLQTVTSPSSIEQFIKAGYTNLTLQKGRGKFLPPDIQYDGFEITCYDYKPSLAEDFDEAGLVISHAGAGSILESLRLHKLLIVVINEELMDNHQYELATKMADEGYLYYCTCKGFLNTFVEKDLGNLTRKEDPDPRVFGDFLDHFVGVER